MQNSTKMRESILIRAWDSFTLSDKLKFAIKASLSMALAYLIPFSQGWSQPGTAATTVMLIAAMGSVGDSVMKGALRVIGTVIGAIIGMTLIGLFPQDREIYLLLASVIVTVLLYLARAYKGDMTVFLLSAITLLMMFQNGEVENVFSYGVDKTFMTIVGIIIYTLVGVFLWPISLTDTSRENISTLSTLQAEIYRERDSEYEVRKALYEKMVTQEQLLESSIIAFDRSSIDIGFSKRQWHDIVHNYTRINESLTMLSTYDKAFYVDDLPRYVNHYQKLDTEIIKLLESISLAWKEEIEIEIPETFKLEYHVSEIKELSHLDRASLSTTVKDMIELHTQLCKLAEKLNSLISPMPTFFELEDIPKPSAFLWFDMEHLKGSLITFMIFWTSTLLWIYVNPPGGFLIVTLATGLSVITTFSPVKPSLLIIIFSFSFVFATLMYIFVLPHLYYGWQLGLFVFIYAFIGFYFINVKMSVFFLLGTVTLGIVNEMDYNFNVFLITLFIFYLFLILLLLFYYIPFSTKPEHLVLIMKKRFFVLSQKLLQSSNNLSNHRETFWGNLAAKYSEVHLMSTVKKMQLWASQIDPKYFDTLDQKVLLGFSKECENFVYLLQMMYYREVEMKDNMLIKAFKKKYTAGVSMVDLLGEYASGKDVEKVDAIWKNEKMFVTIIEENLADFLNNIKSSDYSKNEILEFYEHISLRRNVWISLLSCQNMMKELDFKVLERKRF